MTSLNFSTNQNLHLNYNQHVLNYPDANTLYQPNLEYYNYHQQFVSDQNWLNNWMKQKEISKKTKHEQLKISDAQSALKLCCTILMKLKQTEHELQTNITKLSNLNWEQRLMECDKQKAMLLNALTPFDNSNLFKQLQANIKQRKLKRIGLKQKRTQLRHNKLDMMNKRRQIDASIDEWLAEQREQVEKIKRDEKMQRDADCVLAEVTKKRADARRQLALLTALVKLRTIRQTTAEGRGEKVSLDDNNTFITITERLKNMWQKALDKYDMEEQNLKTMLKSKSKPDLNMNNENKDDKKYENTLKEWELVLFGEDYIPSDAYWVLTCANRDLETFIALRKSWDTFLNSPDDTQGSNIPIGWVVPQPPSSLLWSKYLQLD